MATEHRIERIKEKVERHESEIHPQFDRRISRNENFRLQAQGALKVIAIMLGSGAVAWLLNAAGLITL